LDASPPAAASKIFNCPTVEIIRSEDWTDKMTKGRRTLRCVIIGVLGVGAFASAPILADDGGSTPASYQAHVVSRAEFKDGAVHLRPNAAECRAQPIDGVRQRIIDLAFGAWAAFGQPSLDLLAQPKPVPGFSTPLAPTPTSDSGPSRLALIAGFWGVVPWGGKYIREQNDRWHTARDQEWREHWSAAFTSWVMCESGLDNSQFLRSAAHRDYIRNALTDDRSAFKLMPGTSLASPGDMLCASEDGLPNDIVDQQHLDALNDRMLHCYVVVEANEQVTFVIGGNVIDWSTMPRDKFGTVSLLILNNRSVAARGWSALCARNRPCWLLGLALKGDSSASFVNSALSPEARALLGRR
jgi:hypothetical protein